MPCARRWPAGAFACTTSRRWICAAAAWSAAEALLRWRDPSLGEVAPARFIPVAEDSGFIVALGDWVLTEAVRQGADWHRRGMATPIAINVSALQFQQPQFVDRVAAALAGRACRRTAWSWS